MLYLLFCVVWLIVSLKKSKVLKLLIMIQIVSVFFALLSGMTYEISTFYDILNIVYIFIVVYLFSSPFANVKVDMDFRIHEYGTILKISKRLNILMTFLLVIIVYGSYFVLTQVNDIGDFRYSEGVKDRLMSRVGLGGFSLFITIFSYLAVVLIVLHFYFLLKRRYLTSFVCLFNSLVLPFSGILSFTRTTVIEFLILYTLNCLLFYGSLDAKTKKYLRRIGFALLSVIVIYFIYVTFNRFEGREEYRYIMTNEWIYSHPVFASIISYFSQWYKNGLHVLSEFDGPFYYGLFSFRVIHLLLDKLGIVEYGLFGYGDMSSELYQTILPDYWFLFNGMPAVMYVEFGYFGSILLAVLFNLFAKYILNKQKGISYLLVLNVLFILPALSIVGFYFKVYGYQYLVIWVVLILKYLNKKCKNGSVCS